MSNLLTKGLQGTLWNGIHKSDCIVMQQVSGQGQTKYYTNPEIMDSTVSPHLVDGDYNFQYSGEAGPPATVTRRDGFWWKVPPSSRNP